MKKQIVKSTAMALCLTCVAPMAGMFSENIETPPPAPPPVVTPAPAPTAIPQFQQEAEKEWQRLQEVWESLPKNKKEQLYKAMEAVDKADLNFIEKAADLKLITPEVAAKMREYIKGRTARIREDGGLPMYRKHHR